jgi:hypothetical protein
MLFDKCPGQDKRFWKPEDIFDIVCPSCGQPVEFFKDEPKRKCSGCGEGVRNPRVWEGCAKWCPYAEQCLGTVPSPEPTETVEDRLVWAMKKVFATDTERIDHALLVLKYADRLLEELEGCEVSPLLVKAAAILHDIGLREAGLNYPGEAAREHGPAGEGLARDILRHAGVEPETAERVCAMIRDHHRRGAIDSEEFRILRDADRLVNWPDEHRDLGGEALRAAIEEEFETGAGREMARRLYVRGESGLE